MPPALREGADPFQPVTPKVGCSSCKLRALCLPRGLTSQALSRVDPLVDTRRPVARGAALFRVGEPFEALYAVHSGFLKTCLASGDSRRQVIGFHMSGELLGLDGISAERHGCDAVALEDSQVCVIPYRAFEQLARDLPDLQRRLNHLMSAEIARAQGVMRLLGSLRAEERLAAFLVDLTERLKARGFSSAALVLRMTRGEIGTYLGLTFETVSRCFSKLQDDAVLEVRQRHVRVLDPQALQRLADRATG